MIRERSGLDPNHTWITAERCASYLRCRVEGQHRLRERRNALHDGPDSHHGIDRWLGTPFSERIHLASNEGGPSTAERFGNLGSHVIHHLGDEQPCYGMEHLETPYAWPNRRTLGSSGRWLSLQHTSLAGHTVRECTWQVTAQWTPCTDSGTCRYEKYEKAGPNSRTKIRTSGSTWLTYSINWVSAQQP